MMGRSSVTQQSSHASRGRPASRAGLLLLLLRQQMRRRGTGIASRREVVVVVVLGVHHALPRAR
jgi:hypothetical protein